MIFSQITTLFFFLMACFGSILNKKNCKYIGILVFLAPLSIQAQKLEAPTFQTDSLPDTLRANWTGGGGLGLDGTAITLINPRVGEGEGRVNAGILLNFWLNFQSKRLLWNNRGSVQLALTREGTEDWTKATDAFMWNTQVGFRVFAKWYAAAMADVQTQLLKTYDSKYIQSQTIDLKPRSLTSRFFAPATVRIAPGLLWKPKPYFSLLVSAVSNKNIIVADKTLAMQGDSTLGESLLGNEWSSAADFSSISSQFGAEIRADLNLKFADDKVTLMSSLDLYSNYLKKPENIATEWLTSVDIALFNNFSVNFRSDWFYDHNVLVQIGGNLDDLGRRVFIRNTFFLKYNKTF
jgi:Protein of unknown function (DUF3078)